jgi:cytochrome c-type biogenesis protein CcmH/NrfF
MKCNICKGKKWLKYHTFKEKIKCPYCDATGIRGSDYSSSLDIQVDVYNQYPDGDIFYKNKTGEE